MVFGWRRETSTRCDTNPSLSQMRYSLRDSIFSWSPSRGTVLRLMWRFVDLRRQATIDVDCPRENSKDEHSNFGGLVIYHRTALTTRRVNIPDRPTTFEALAVSVASPQGPLTVINIYRPGSEAPSAAFFVELAALFEHFAYTTHSWL